MSLNQNPEQISRDAIEAQLRTLDHDGLRKVSSAAKSAKTHCVIVDTIGVSRSLKTASRPPITRRPSRERFARALAD